MRSTNQIALALSLLTLCATSFAQSVSQNVAQPYKVSVLGTLKGGSGYARALNVNGEAVGSSGEPHGADLSAALWDRNEKVNDLGRLPGGDQSEATAVNDAGVVVGWSDTARNMKAFGGGSGALADLAPV